MNTETETRHTLEDLARLTEFPVRTIRYYIQEGLVARPFGEKRAAHYTARHLEQLLTIRKWQSAGLSLERIRELLSEPESGILPPPRPRGPGTLEVWSHVVIADGLEITLEPGRAGLSAEQVRAFARGVMALYGDIRAAGEEQHNKKEDKLRDANQETAALLRDANGRPVALTGVSVQGRLNETLASIEVEQRYRNPFDHNIEAVYTFPLPIGAVLLELAVDIDGRTLSGQVLERKAAERQYEEAITDGDSAVMVTDNGNGLYTMNLGNLMAFESAVIRYRYALTLAWMGDRLRLLIPTSVAPRYGNPQDAGLEDWEAPGTDLFVEYPFTLAIAIDGKLADCEVGSPTHPISVGCSAGGLQARLADGACLDRDFVLTARSGEAGTSSLLVCGDGGEQVAFASLRIPQVKHDEDAPLCLKLVIDCSGSMSGSSIAQARKGALAILDQLRPQDYVSVTLFGNDHEHLFPRLMPCNSDVLESLRERLEHLDADMGGTETANALDSVYKLSGKFRQPLADWQAEHCPTSSAAVLLITDGEIWDTDHLLERAGKSKHRVFTVGVGMAVGGGLVSGLARATGGACELVAPREGMAERILAQFHRMRQPTVAPIEVAWDASPIWQTAVPENLFAGDTVTIFAGFVGTPPTQLAFSGGTNGSVMARRVELPDVPRLAASIRIGELGEANAELGLSLALRHQLLTRSTSFLVIAERKEKADDLPELHKVPHMMPAGMFESAMHGSSRHYALDMCADSPVDLGQRISAAVSPCLDAPAVMRSIRSGKARRLATLDFGDDIPSGEMPESGGFREQTTASSPGEFIKSLERVAAGSRKASVLPSSVHDMEALGLPESIASALRQRVATTGDEATIVAAFLHALSESSLSGLFGRSLRRLVLAAWKRLCADRTCDQWLAASLAAATESTWDWIVVPEDGGSVVMT